MAYDIIIRNGRVIDPAYGIDRVGTVYVKEDRIVEPTMNNTDEALQVIDASGCLVIPGLIDFHTHLFYTGSMFGAPPDPALLPMGVTTAVDAGTAGVANYEAFHNTVIVHSMVRIKSFLNVAAEGQVTPCYPENLNPKFYDESRITALFQKYHGELVGLKVRVSIGLVADQSLTPLRRVLQIADGIGCPVAVHATDPPREMEELIKLLRCGDILVHAYHGKGRTIIGSDGKVLPAIWEGKRKGVLFDVANGFNNFAFKTAREALLDGLKPDIISSDLTMQSMYQFPVYGLPYIISKYLCLGMDLMEAVGACTVTPAGVLGMKGEIGTLAPGSCADIAVFKLSESAVKFEDSLGETETGHSLLIPQLTIRAGKILFRQLDFM